MRKILRLVLLGAAVILGVFSLYFFVGSASEAQEITWGVNFSKKHAENLGLDWRVAYVALLDDLKVTYLKVSLDWNELEPEKDSFSFANADWQVQEAEKREAKLLLVVGMKTVRWPECHIPEWAKDLSKQEQQQEILQLLKATVERYKDSPAVYAWQVENEPLLSFGNCPWRDQEFFEKRGSLGEVARPKSADRNIRQRRIFILDSSWQNRGYCQCNNVSQGVVSRNFKICGVSVTPGVLCEESCIYRLVF